MLMKTPDSLKQLRPIASALSPEDFDFIGRRALEISATLDGRYAYRNAEIYPDVTPHWHVATALPGMERTAAQDLSDRCFGIYLPESEHVEVRRGRRAEFTRLMLPGYVFVFVWDVDRHIDRIRACDGVRGLLFINGQAAIVPDRVSDRVRVAENRERPLKMEVEVIKKKRRWRKSHKTIEEQNISNNDIIGVHSYSPFIEAMRQEAEGDRLSAFHRAIGLLPCNGTPNQPNR